MDTVELNAIINTKIYSKKLRLSANKCNHLHISKTNTNCYSNLKADVSTMKKSTVCSYLGDILNSSGSLDSTIENRRQKGIGLCSQITGIVNSLSLGHYYFEISFLLRESMFLNGTLTNAEIWYPISEKQVEVLENVDLMLIRKLLKGHSKATKESFHMETGLLPIRFVIMKRRLMYLFNILRKPKSELIRKVYDVQKTIKTKNDWYNIVQENKIYLEISQSDEEIGKMSKERFKLIVRKSVEKKAVEYLNNIACKHSKSKELIKNKLSREGYLKDQRFSKSESELLFAIRTRMVLDIKRNFPTQYNNNFACDLCQVQVDCQEHLLSCVELRKYVNVPVEVNYSDIYGNTDKQLKIVKLFKQLLRTREILKCN